MRPSGKRQDRGQTHVARLDLVFALLFDVAQKVQNRRCVEISNTQDGRFLSGGLLEEPSRSRKVSR